MPSKIEKSDKLLYQNKLRDFLVLRKAKDFFSHTSIGKPLGSFYIRMSETDEFLDIYHNVVFEQKIPIYLTEGIKDLENTPLKVDLDFRYFRDKAERIYVENDIKQICIKYMEIIEEYLEDIEDSDRIFYILEKPNPTVDKDKSGNENINSDGLKKIKDGIHIMAPGIVTNVYLQHKFRKYVYKNCNDILDKHKFDNNYSDIFDSAVIDRNNWQMYGSTKPDQPPYVVSKMYMVYTDRVEEIHNIPSSKELVHLLSIRNKFDHSLIKPDKEDEVFHTIEIPKRKITSKKNRKEGNY